MALNMPLTPQEKKLLALALYPTGSKASISKVLKVLSDPDADISTIVHRFPDLDNAALRRALGQTAKLLEVLEQSGGLANPLGGGSPVPSAAKLGKKTLVPPAQGPKKRGIAPPHRPSPAAMERYERELKKARIYIDGSSKGNPGPMAAGIVIVSDPEGDTVLEEGLSLGRGTNNVAEYRGLLRALQWAKRLNLEEVTVFSDSQLMVNQFSGQYKLKNEVLRDLCNQARERAGQFHRFDLKFILRTQNKRADQLANWAGEQEESATP
ncbi:MAG: reverse transcriptase-like protein [bacterium]